MWIAFFTAVFLSALITIMIALSIPSQKEESSHINKSHDAEVIKCQEETVPEEPANAEVIVRHTFWDNEMDKFLRRSYPALRQWNTMGHPIGTKFDGSHLCELLFWNGTKKIVTVIIKSDIAIEIAGNTSGDKQPEGKSKSPEEIAKEWIAEKKNFLLEKYQRGEGFLIENKDLPNDDLTVDLILAYLTANGNFSTHYGSEGIRCVAEY